MSATDFIAEFISFMESEGVKPVEPIAQRLATGELIRFRCDGDGKGRDNGWAIIYLDDRPAGAFGNYRLGKGTRKWKSGSNAALTSAERAALQREWSIAKANREAERIRSETGAMHDAAEMWTRAKYGPHPYLEDKGMDGAELRVLGGQLLVPMFEDSGTLCNLQRIENDGTKRFLKGGRTAGLFAMIGDFTGATTVCIGEGYATMHAVYRASRHPCIVAFSTANLTAVAQLWHVNRPDLQFILCADDDAHLEAVGKENAGRIAAERAATIIGARVAYPPRTEAA